MNLPITKSDTIKIVYSDTTAIETKDAEIVYPRMIDEYISYAKECSNKLLNDMKKHISITQNDSQLTSLISDIAYDFRQILVSKVHFTHNYCQYFGGGGMRGELLVDRMWEFLFCFPQ